ncbi:hypothetical protein M8J76_010777 [Diaphorina citri]|jgi:hypothetical protein|nr:hypothetical protein M8J76_010777 [Diaphorina citri]KAI5721255.1 hypothetical protein M8J77_018241 [Diaphorina citri]
MLRFENDMIHSGIFLRVKPFRKTLADVNNLDAVENLERFVSNVTSSCVCTAKEIVLLIFTKDHQIRRVLRSLRASVLTNNSIRLDILLSLRFAPIDANNQGAI